MDVVVDYAAEDMTVETPLHNLPVRLTSFVGRSDELAGVVARLEGSRLVTITGPGGAGKSRLVLEAAASVVHHFPEGVWFVELMSTETRAGIVSAIGTVLDIPEVPGTDHAETIMQRLRTRTTLIILDNCEHVADVVGEIIDPLLGECPDVTFAATSRERLGIRGEVLWPISGLDYPDPSGPAWYVSELPEAVKLFVERGGAVNPAFVITESNAFDVASICERLDGLPLAIELAAARLNAYSVADINRRLDDALAFLTSTLREDLGRHSSLHRVVSWSYGLLSEQERLVFRRLGVFAGGFDLELGVEVAGYDMHPGLFERAIESLIDKSLLARTTSAGPEARFRLLESLRQFSLDLLVEGKEIDELGEHHAQAYARLADVAEPELWGAGQVAWLNRLERDHANLLAALSWGLDHDEAELAQRIAGSMSRFWDLRGHYSEGLEWLRLSATLDGAVTDEVGVRLFNGLATLAVLNGEIELAMESCERSIQMATVAGDDAGRAYGLQYLGLCWIYAQDLMRAEDTLRESIRAAEAAKVPMLIGWSSIFLSAVAAESGRSAEMKEIALTARHALIQAEELEGIGWSFIAEGISHRLAGSLHAAAINQREGLKRFRTLRAGWGISVAGVVAATIWLDLEQWEAAACTYARSELLRAAVGAVHLPTLERWIGDGCERARGHLGTAEFDRVWTSATEVRVEDVPQLIRDDLDELIRRTERIDIRSPRSEANEVLLRREGDVWLLAQGDMETRLRHLVGFAHLATLLNNPNREYAALELATADRGAAFDPGRRREPDLRIAPSGVGPTLDHQATSQYRQRVADLQEELDEAEEWSDIERAARVRTEIDAIASELSSSIGLGGRSRPVSSDAERARVNVTKAIRSAIGRITKASPPTGAHLEASITTGTFCKYSPDPSSPIRWHVEP